MASRFSLSVPGRRGPSDPWFRIGTIDVTTTILVILIQVAGFVVYAFNTTWLLEKTALASSLFKNGEVWRAITWPLYNEPTIWAVFMLAIFWYFGTEIERLLGRTRFAVFLLIITVVPGILAGLLNLAPDYAPIYGFRTIEMCVFLLFIAEYPFARFFLGIPAWAIGAVIVAIEFIQLVGNRQERELVFRLIAIVVAAVTARSMGLLMTLPWIPAIPLGRFSGGGKSRRRRSSPKRSSGRAPGPPPAGGGDVIAGPWTTAGRSGPTSSASLPPPPVSPSDAAADQAELDALLDKISDAGMDGLTGAEKQRLNELSKRMRNRR